MDTRSPNTEAASNWMFRMFALVLLEKIVVNVSVGFALFTIPFGVAWLKVWLLGIPSLFVIDVLYGRIIAYCLAASLLNLRTSRSSYLEAAIYFFSLLFSFAVVIAFSGQAQILLFSGEKPWSCIAFHLTVVALMGSIMLTVRSVWLKKINPPANPASLAEDLDDGSK